MKSMCGKCVRRMGTDAAGICQCGTCCWIEMRTFTRFLCFPSSFFFLLSSIVPAASALLLHEADVAYRHLFVNGLDHVVEREGGNTDSSKCFHFHAGPIGRADA